MKNNINQEYTSVPWNEHSRDVLLDRPHPEGYTSMWTETISQEIQDLQEEHYSTLIFRIKDQWLAFYTQWTQEVTEKRFIHKLPHKTNKKLLGITNVEGELYLSFSLQALLEISEGNSKKNKEAQQRVIIFSHKEHCFAFPVDEIYGVFNFPESHLEPISKSTSTGLANYIEGIFSFHEHRVGLINASIIAKSATAESR